MLKVDLGALEEIMAERPNVLAAWLFGSAQAGQIRVGSDVDVGVWFEEAPTLDELAELRAQLQETLQFDDIDIVALNNASPITRFEAVRGRLICTRNREAMAGFVSLAAREYESSMALLRQGMAWRRDLEKHRASER